MCALLNVPLTMQCSMHDVVMWPRVPSKFAPHRPRAQVAPPHLVTLTLRQHTPDIGGNHTEAVSGALPPEKNKPLCGSLPRGPKR